MDILSIIWTAALTLVFAVFVALNPVPFIITAVIIVALILYAKHSGKRTNNDKIKSNRHDPS